MYISRSYRPVPREKRSFTDKMISVLLAAAMVLPAVSCSIGAEETTTGDAETSSYEKPYDPEAKHLEDFDILVPSDVNTYEGGTNFWNLYFFDTDKNIYVDESYPVGTKGIVLQLHTFSYNHVGDVYYFDVYRDGELIAEKNIFTNHTDLADFCEITYAGDGTGLTKGRYTIVIYDVNSTTTVCCVAYCVVK